MRTVDRSGSPFKAVSRCKYRCLAVLDFIESEGKDFSLRKGGAEHLSFPTESSGNASRGLTPMAPYCLLLLRVEATSHAEYNFASSSSPSYKSEAAVRCSMKACLTTFHPQPGS